MCTYKAYIDNLARVIYPNHQTILISLDVKDYPVTRQNRSRREVSFDIGRTRPGNFVDEVVKVFKDLFSSSMLLPIKAKSLDGDHMHIGIIPHCSQNGNICDLCNLISLASYIEVLQSTPTQAIIG
jgi:hypothetical protein